LRLNYSISVIAHERLNNAKLPVVILMPTHFYISISYV
jgi:hypothetical protein